MTAQSCPRCSYPDRSRYHSCRRPVCLGSPYEGCTCPDCAADARAQMAAEMAAEMAVERYYEDRGWEEAERDRVEEERRGVVSFADAWDAADPSRTAPCRRHGTPKVHDRCWECDMERDEARRDEEERIQVATFKMRRDARLFS